MFEIPTGLPPEIVPLSWLLGVWEGTGVVDYPVDGESVPVPFGQRVSFSHDGQAHLNYNSYTWILAPQSAGDVPATSLAVESGYFRLSRPAAPSDAGPAMLPATAPAAYPDAEAVETLRQANGAFEIEASIVHPTGVLELYLGRVLPGRIDLATDAVVRSASAKEYTAATRLYGLVEGDLLWAWDIAALGQELRSHASARLSKAQ